MDHVFGNLEFVKIYIDDILIYSSSLKEHLVHLKQFFQMCRKTNLFCELKKMVFTLCLNEIFLSGIRALFRVLNDVDVVLV